MLTTPSNPFATRFIRAGELPFVFQSGQSLEELHRRLQQSNWRGQIVGPHGSGKSTLLKSLEPCWSGWGRHPQTIVLKDGNRSLPRFSKQNDFDTLVIDGYEQLSLLSRWKLLAHCDRYEWGLIVTTHHRTTGLPVLIETDTNEQLAKQLTQRLLRERPVANSDELLHSVPSYLNKHSGNLREMFLSLYDEVAQ